MSAIGAASLKSYTDYEQLVGGIETLFGAGGAKNVKEYADSAGKSIKDVNDEFLILRQAQKIALENADKAYKTAGLSANEYMETVTSFAAALKASTENEVEAAKAADQAVIDMADNANKMGSSMESIQNAYQGFAKQNYTMLDNLKLGYGGTKEEMVRLLEDAEKLTGIKYDINNLNDVYSAIHVIQTELGITGTTAKEASTTISGSVNSVKASWTNLVTAIATGEGIDSQVDAFVESLVTASDNIIPRVGGIVDGIGDVISALIPHIKQKAPQMINAGIEMVSNLATGFIKGLPKRIPKMLAFAQQIIDGISQYGPPLLEKGYEILSDLIDGFVESIPEKLPLILDFIQNIADGMAEKAPILISKGFELLGKLVSGIISALPILIERVPTIITTFANIINDNFPTILLKGAELIWELIKGIISAIPTLIQNIPKIIEAIVSVIQAFEWMNLGKNIIKWFKDGITGMINAVKEAAESIRDGVKDKINELPTKLKSIGKDAISNLSSGISGKLEDAKKAAKKIFDGITGSFDTIFEDMKTIGKNIIEGIWSGISGAWGWLLDKVGEVASSLFKRAQKELDIQSPSRKFKWLGEMCVAGWDEGSEGLMDFEPFAKGVQASFASMKMNVTDHGIHGVKMSGTGGIQQTININQPISTPDEMARAIRLESRYGLMRGIAYG